MEMPSWYTNYEGHDPACDWWIGAFFELCSDRRGVGIGIGPIPWSSINRYGCSRGLRGGMLKVFEHVIRLMDDTYLEWQEQDRKARAGKK